MQKQQPFVSFVIPHKGREQLLSKTLRSICLLDYPKDRIETIVVTQNQRLEEGTLPDRSDLEVQILFRPATETISALRNRGVDAARGEYLAFLDADIYLDPNWVTAMLTALAQKPSRVLVSAIPKPPLNPTMIERIRCHINGTEERVATALSGQNLFLRRLDFEKIGGFPEHLTTCEDTFFTGRAHGIGEVFVSGLSAYVHLGEDKSYSQLFKKEIWRSRSNLKSLRGRPIPIREYPSILLPFWYTTFVIAALVSIFLGRSDWIAVSVLLTLLPVLIYAANLYRKSKGAFTLWECWSFFFVYFPARAIGSIRGLFSG